MKRAAYDAFENYLLFKTFGMPKAGGYDEQDVDWVDCMNACTYSEQKVEKEIQREEEKKADEMRKKKK